MNLAYIFLFFIFLGISLLYQNKKYLLKIFFGITASLLILPINYMLKNVGADSFTEIQNFNYNEAIFFLTSIHSYIDYFKFNRFLNSLILFLLIFFVVNILRKKNILNNTNLIGCIFLILGFSYFIYSSFNSFKLNSNIYAHYLNKFSVNPLPNINTDVQNLSIIVYIGESTSSMNMSFYGYPRKTTPLIEKIPSRNIIKIDNVISTHTHTTPSLLRALSIPLAGQTLNDEFSQKRVSIVDVINKTNFKSSLYSNQSYHSYNNFTSSIIFKNVISKNFSGGENLFGNVDLRDNKPYDHEYFFPIVDDFIKNESTNDIIFLHSYAGHGPYLENIPNNYQYKIDNYYSSKNIEVILKDPKKDTRELIENYDSAITYIDNNLYTIFQKIQKQKKPIILIYFSDHGDSVFTNNIHDSTRPELEMLTVPFILFFNDSAIEKLPTKYSELKRDSKKNKLGLLDQFPRLLMDLISNDFKNFGDFIDVPKKYGENIQKSSQNILNRNTNSGKKYIKLSGIKFNTSNYGSDAIGSYLISKNLEQSDKLCIHGANNLESIIRGKLVSDCLEFDLVIDENLNVYHPPKKNYIPLNISELINRNTKKNTFWIDAKNIDNHLNCLKLKDFLQKEEKSFTNVMIEFPSSTEFNNEKLLSCAKELSYHPKIELSYYINTNNAYKCIKENEVNACNSIDEKIKSLKSLGIFKNISFDKVFNEKIDENKYPFNFNSWSYAPFEITDEILKKQRKIIYRNINN